MKPRIIFMGTPEFAVPSLEVLLANDFNIVAVITATDKMGGRGKKQLLQSAVKKCALGHNIPVLQPRNLKAPDFVEQLRSFRADLQIVVAFRMLPEVVWNMPPMGTMNLHGSLLPAYRGAAPINWAIIHGESKTGLTTFMLKHEIDTGDLLFTTELEIGENETAGDLHDRMKMAGARLVLRSVGSLLSGDYQLIPQDDALVSKAPKIRTEDCRIDFRQSVNRVHNFIRGLSPYPGAWTVIDGKKVKLLRTLRAKSYETPCPGRIELDSDQSLFIHTRDGRIRVLELQMEGKRRMEVPDFLNGYLITSSAVSESM